MNKRIEAKLKQLPNAPGVYFHKDRTGEIIYVGKAAVLKNRVRQYFQASRNRDPKTEALVAEITDLDWMVVDSEIEALFLEAEMIRRYMPRYNVLLRDDKALSYIRIDYDSDYPTVGTTRRPLDDGARYFGPYYSTSAVRAALKLLRRIFPYATRKIPGQKRASLHYHLGLDPGLEEGKTSLEEYRANLRKLMAIIEGKRTNIIRELEREMKAASKQQRYEDAAHIRNRLLLLQNLNKQVVFSDKEFLDISKDHALNELVDLLSLKGFPRRIEGYDISHMQGTNVVASMVVFTNGVSDKAQYRKFKTRQEHNNDFFNMNETIARRLSETNLKKWGKPDLILIDGGKGQLDAALRARDEAGQSNIPFVGLAKREEQIVISKDRSGVTLSEQTLHKLGGYSNLTTAEHSTPQGHSPTFASGQVGSAKNSEFILVNVPHSTNVVKLLQRIRDESHRFVVSYDAVLKRQKQTASVLDGIPGVGPTTRKKLLRTFGSVRGITQASEQELAVAVGAKKAAVIYKALPR